MTKVKEAHKRTKHYLRSAKGIKVGDKFTYISRGFEISDGDGTCIISKGAEYDAEVIQVTKYLITLSLLVDQTTIHRGCTWEPRPYNWSIRKVDIGTSEKLYLFA